MTFGTIRALSQTLCSSGLGTRSGVWYEPYHTPYHKILVRRTLVWYQCTGNLFFEKASNACLSIPIVNIQVVTASMMKNGHLVTIVLSLSVVMMMFWSTSTSLGSYMDSSSLSTAAAPTTAEEAEDSQPAPDEESLPLPNGWIPLKLPSPVFVVGFPKSGTTSTYQFFSCNGLITQHYCAKGDLNGAPPCPSGKMAACIIQNLAKKSPMLEGCGLYQAYCQIDGERPTRRGKEGRGTLMNDGSVDTNSLMRLFLPQHHNLHQLSQENPTATFVLPLRTPREWARSVMKWFQMKGHVINEYMYYNKTMVNPKRTGQVQPFLERIYVEHTHFVRDFVKHHPQHALVEVNISDPRAGTQMADAFGLNATCWGHQNMGAAHEKLQNNK